MSLIKHYDWIEIAKRENVDPNDMLLIYAPEGNYAYVAGMHLEETITQNPNVTHYYPFASPPITVVKPE